MRKILEVLFAILIVVCTTTDGQALLFSLDDTYDFGTVEIGNYRSKLTTITNDESFTVKFMSKVEGVGFGGHYDTSSHELDPDEVAYRWLKFTPTDKGSFAGVWEVNYWWFEDGASTSTQLLHSVSLVGNAAPVPEPATMLLLGTGLVGIAGFGRKKFFKK